MPLNLWFYHSHNLVTLDGKLWVAAVVCCVLYAASALVLRDPLFVYVLTAGVAGTGLLILADLHKFAEIAAAVDDARGHGPDRHPRRARVRRQRRAASAANASGWRFFSPDSSARRLALLLLAQATTWIIKPILPAFQIIAPEITTVQRSSWWRSRWCSQPRTAYVYSELLVRRVGSYVYAAAFTLLWAELLGLQVLNLRYGPR